MGIGERLKRGLVLRRQGDQVSDDPDQDIAGHGRHGRLAHSEFNLRNVSGSRQAREAVPQQGQQSGRARVQDSTGVHLRHITARPFAKAYEQPTFFIDPPNRQPRPRPIAQGWPPDWREHLCGPKLADVPEVVLEDTLLDGHLGRGRRMLHAAATAHPEMRTGRHGPIGRLRAPFHRPGLDVTRSLPKHLDHHILAGEPARHKDDLALVPRDALGLQVNRLNSKRPHAPQRLGRSNGSATHAQRSVVQASKKRDQWLPSSSSPG